MNNFDISDSLSESDSDSLSDFNMSNLFSKDISQSQLNNQFDGFSFAPQENTDFSIEEVRAQAVCFFHFSSSYIITNCYDVESFIKSIFSNFNF